MAAMFIVDAFSGRPFDGNAAAVCLLDAPAEPDWMRRVALEMNQAETAFVHRNDNVANRFSLRWFSVSGEVDICGHATIAAAHVLWENRWLQTSATAEFETRAGLLTATRNGKIVTLDFPADPAREIGPDAALAAALGASPTFVGRGEFYTLARFARDSDVRALTPDFTTLARVVGDGVICTARSDDRRYDVFSRYFGPSVGNPEDTVTGSSACLLGPYWAPELGKPKFVARQQHGTTSRGGVIEITVRGNRVGIGGEALTTLVGTLVG
jgi:PhzF family phenazine biosynthesis protein